MINEIALNDWLQYRKEIKKPLKPMSIDRVIKKLSQHSQEIQEAMVEQSIENGWQGLFDVKRQAQPAQLGIQKTSEVDFVTLHTDTSWRELL